MRPLDPILEKLSCAQTAFFRAADSVSPEQWKTKPKADEWSAAELVAHLVTVERAIIGGADRITQKNSETDSVSETIPFPNVAGREQDHSAQISDSTGSQSAEHEGRNAGRIASGTRTNFVVFGGDVEEGFAYVLLAASVFGNVKRV
jgi:uncharacterized damage-inducible protein DinB